MFDPFLLQGPYASPPATSYRVWFEDDEGRTAHARVSASALQGFLSDYAGRVIEIREESPE